MMVSAVSSPAGFWKRYVAYFIDLVLIYIVLELLVALFFSALGISYWQQARELLTMALNPQSSDSDPAVLLAQTESLLVKLTIFSSIAYAVLAGAYFVLCESSEAQATLGKRMIGIKVTDLRGQRIGRGRALARFLATGLSWLSLNLGHALAAWTPQRRSLHDYLASTRVENVDPSHAAMPFWAWVVIGAHALIFLLTILGMLALVAYIFSAIGTV